MGSFQGAEKRRGRRRAGKGAGAVIAALLLIGTLAYVARDNFDLAPAVGVVRPGNPDGLDPQVRELIDAKLAQVEADPGSGAAHGDLGLVYEANELWDEAAASLANAAKLDPDEPLWVFHQGLATERAGDVEGGRALLEQAARRLPSEVGVQLRMAYALLDAGDLDGAERAFEQVARLVPGRPEPYAGLGELQLARGEHADAARQLERALGLEGAPRIAHYTLGLAYRGLGRLEEAERELLLGQGAERQYIGDRLYPKVHEYAVYYAFVIDEASELLASGAPAAAARLLEGLRAHRPDDTNVLNNLSVAYLQQGKVDEALELLEHALELDERAFATHQNLTACALTKGDRARALRHAERAVELAPDVASTHAALMQVLVATGRFDEAYASASTASELDPADLNKRLAVAELCMQLRRYPEARTRFGAILGLAPDHLPAHLNLVAACVATGDVAAAEEALARAEVLAPGHARVEAARRMVEGAR